jgi:hypothetical protein
VGEGAIVRDCRRVRRMGVIYKVGIIGTVVGKGEKKDKEMEERKIEGRKENGTRKEEAN